MVAVASSHHNEFVLSVVITDTSRNISDGVGRGGGWGREGGRENAHMFNAVCVVALKRAFD